MIGDRTSGARARESIDVAFVRRRTGLVYVRDPEALAVFEDGEVVFDVDLHCRNLDAFIERHNLDAVIESENILPCANPEAEKRPVYFGRTRRQKRRKGQPLQTA